MVVFTKHEEMMRTAGFMPPPPPLEIVDHPDLLERAWGWDRLMLTDFFSENGYAASQYKKYLQQYYTHNGGQNINGYGDNDINLFLKMECEFMSRLNQCRHSKLCIDEFRLSKKITNHVRQMTNANCPEFGTAAVALKCITKEAHMLCELIESKYMDIPTIATSSCIRKFALRFMNYKGCDVAASAIMMAIMKEADLMFEFLEKRPACDDKCVLLWSRDLRNCAMGLMPKICPDNTGNAGKLVPDEPAGKLVPDEPDGKNCLVKTILPESNKINQKTKDASGKGDSRLIQKKSTHGTQLKHLFAAEDLESQNIGGKADVTLP